MTVITCERCDTPFDTDNQQYCVVEHIDGSPVAICENCQESAWMRNQERLMEDGPGPSLLDQQREAMKLK